MFFLTFLQTKMATSLFTCLFLLIILIITVTTEEESINSLHVLEKLSRMALLRHHPQSVHSNADNMTESFASLLNDLHQQNLTLQDRTELNCSSLDTFPKSLCVDGTLSKCLSAEEMLSLVPANTRSVSEALARLCPLLLLQLHGGTCSHTQTEGLATPSSLRPSSLAVWGYGVLFVTIISCCSLVGVVLLPLLSSHIYATVLMLFEGLAVGSLVGSSLFHLIPQTFKLVGQDKEHNYLWRSLLIFGGIYLFYISERLMKVIMDVKKQKKDKQKSLYKASDNSTELLKSPPELNGSAFKNGKVAGTGNGAIPVLTTENGLNYTLIAEAGDACKPYRRDSELSHGGHHHDHQVHFEKGESAIGTVAWMIIFGDGLHNFIDGLSIGAAFSESLLAGVSISVAVICEEFPHELGDFAVLLSAGMTMRQALLYNFLSAITCYAGLVVGILLGNLAEGAPYIFALAAGMFLYIALVDMMGELSEVLEEARKKGLREQLRVFLIQNIGIILGVVILFVMARYAEHFNFEGLSALGGTDVPVTSDVDRVQQLYAGLQDAKSMNSLLTD